jgi:hypothetical protein
MATLTEGLYPSDIIKWEEEDRYSREEALISASQTIVLGALLEPDGGSYKVATCASNVCAIALAPVITAGGEVTTKIPILRRHAKVITDKLTLGGLTLSLVVAALKANSEIVAEDAVNSNTIAGDITAATE